MPAYVIWVDRLLLLGIFVLVPAIAAVIGYAAWKGKPSNWDRTMYWTAFAVSVMTSAFLMVYAQRMEADVRTFQYAVQMALLSLGILFFGVAGGCMVGIFLYCRGKGPMWRGVAPHHEASKGESPDDPDGAL